MQHDLVETDPQHLDAPAHPAAGSALVLVDFQEWIVARLTQGRGRAAAQAAQTTAQAFRSARRPVIHVQYLFLDGSDGGAGSPMTRFVDQVTVRDDETVLTKYGHSAFDRTSLAEVLGAQAIDRVVLTGVVTDGGVLATAVDALAAGLQVVVVPRACAGSDDQAHTEALNRLVRLGARLDWDDPR